VELLGQLDPIVLARARKEEGRLEGAVTCLMCLDEAEDLGEFIGFGGDRADDFGGGSAHGSRPFSAALSNPTTLRKLRKGVGRGRRVGVQRVLTSQNGTGLSHANRRRLDGGGGR
jgi:hypothetical protein